MIKPLTINLFGGPGSGKSTTAAAVFSLLKMHDVNAELVTEFAKDLTWEGRTKALDNQYYVSSKQYHRMWRIKDQVDVIITDSALLLGLMYGENRPQCFDETIMHLFNEFNNMNYFILRQKKFNPKGRNQTEEEAKELDNKILLMLLDNNIRYKIVEGSYKGVNDIAKRVLRRLRKKMVIELSSKKGFFDWEDDRQNSIAVLNSDVVDVTWCEVLKVEIDNAMLMPGEYKEEDGKYYVKRGMLDGHVEVK